MTEHRKAKRDERPIVCGTDFSATAAEAVNIAAELARRLGVKLLLLHVEEFRGLAAADPVLFEALASRNREELRREGARLREMGTLIEEKLLSGSVFNEIVDTAAESGARLIIVGAVGHGVARRLLLGSVAERVAETSAVPTLVVRPGSRLGAWIRGEHPLKVLAGYDFSAASDAALRWLNGMQEIGPCEINVVHSDWPPEVAHRIGYHGPLPLTENPEQIQNLLERDLTERVAMSLPPEKVTVTVEPGWGRPEGNLFELASRQQVDLVVVGTHQRHGLGRLRFGSVSRTVLHHSPGTVAVIPPAPAVPAARLAKLTRVLVATDFSDLGNSAVSYGAAVVHEGGTLRLIHVIDPKAAPTSAGAPGSKPRTRKENPKLIAQLHALVPKEARDRFDLEADVLESGDVAEAIAQDAERFRADAICLGSHGRSGVAKTLLGSVARDVMTKSKRPVLVVRTDEK